MFKKAGSKNPNNTTYQFWRQDNRPMEVTSNSFFNQKMEYIHYNPVEAGFCKKPQDYPYSSAQWYIDKTGLLDIEEILIWVGFVAFNALKASHLVAWMEVGDFLSLNFSVSASLKTEKIFGNQDKAQK